MKLRRGVKEETKEDDGPLDPYAELFRIAGKKEQEEGNVTNSMAMLTAIPEVDLGMEYVDIILVFCILNFVDFLWYSQYSTEEY